MAIFRPVPPDNAKIRELMARIRRERMDVDREIERKVAANQKLEPQVKEYEEILKAQEIMDELEGKKS